MTSHQVHLGWGEVRGVAALTSYSVRQIAPLLRILLILPS